MRFCNSSKVSLALATMLVVGIYSPILADPPGWTITQITNNVYHDGDPHVSGSNIVWAGSDGIDYEIFLYDGTSIIQLTDNNYNDMSPRISGSNVVWEARMGSSQHDEIFMYDGAKITQITSDNYTDTLPQICGSKIVWSSARNENWEVFLYDGESKIQLTSNDWDDWWPQVSNSIVAWQGYGGGDDFEIFLYDIETGTTMQITDNSYLDKYPQVSGSNIAWQGSDGNDSEIFFYDGRNVIQLTDNDVYDGLVQISGSSAVWEGWDGHDEEIFLYNGTNTIQLTNNDYADVHCSISGCNVTWMKVRSGEDTEIFLYDGCKTVQLTENSYNDVMPHVCGWTVGWKGYDDSDGEIFMARPFPEPPIEVRMKFTPKTLNPGSKGKWVKANFVLPEGFLPEDVDTNTPAVIALLGIESDHINVFINEDELVEIEAAFSRSDFCRSATSNNGIEVIVIGLLNSGQNFYGTDTIRIIDKSFEYVAVLAAHWLKADCGKPDWCSGADLDQDTVVNFVDFALFDGCCIEVLK